MTQTTRGIQQTEDMMTALDNVALIDALQTVLVMLAAERVMAVTTGANALGLTPKEYQEQRRYWAEAGRHTAMKLQQARGRAAD